MPVDKTYKGYSRVHRGSIRGVTHYQKHCPGCYVDKAGAAVCPYCGYDESAPRSRLFLPHGIVIGGQYRVGKVLGRPGGFGITYLGWDVNLQQRVAIKEFLPRDICARSMDSLDVTVHTDHDRTGFDFGKEQFLREARIVAKFDHPNVVRVRSFFNANGTAYLVMDYYEGMSLGDYLTNMRRTIEPEVAVPLIIPILEGLEYVHERNVMHRDVKPANIYLAAIGKPILLDFGAARQAAAGDLARSISVVLTEGYAPLEQYQRRTPQGPWTDVYGLAATLLRMVTGQIPAAALDRLGNDPLAQSNFAGLPDALKPALKRAMAVKPGDRYQTATEFRLALQEFRRITEEGAAEVSSPEAPQAVIAPEQRVQAGAEPPTGLPVKSSPAAQPVAPVVPAQAMSEPISLTRRLDVPPQPAPLPERRAAPRSPGAPVRAEPRTVAGARQAARPVGRRKADEWRPLASIVMALLIAVLIAVGSITWLTSQDAPASPALAPATPLAAEPSKAASTQKPSPYLPKPLAARTPLPEMVQIPSGDFEMGDARSRNNEKPVHPVRVAAFKLGLHEVTVAQFRAFVQQSALDQLPLRKRRRTHAVLGCAGLCAGRQPPRGLRQLGRRGGLHPVAVARDRPGVPSAHRGGMGVHRSRGHAHADVVGRPVPGRLCQLLRLPARPQCAAGRALASEEPTRPVRHERQRARMDLLHVRPLRHRS